MGYLKVITKWQIRQKPYFRAVKFMLTCVVITAMVTAIVAEHFVSNALKEASLNIFPKAVDNGHRIVAITATAADFNVVLIVRIARHKLSISYSKKIL